MPTKFKEHLSKNDDTSNFVQDKNIPKDSILDDVFERELKMHEDRLDEQAQAIPDDTFVITAGDHNLPKDTNHPEDQLNDFDIDKISSEIGLKVS